MSGRWTLGSQFRFAAAGLLTLGASAASVQQTAAGADCDHYGCSESELDARGCCPKSQTPAQPVIEDELDTKKADAKEAADAQKAADAGKADTRKAADTRKTVDAKKGASRTRAITEADDIGMIAKKAPSPRRCPANMVAVPGGAFLMGSPNGAGEGDEHPQYLATLATYCIDRTEVSVAAYKQCVAAGKCTAAPEPRKNGFASLCNGSRADRRNHPINCIDWNQAATYCASVNKRLPSESEWEYAARGQRGQEYPWGNAAPSFQHLNACGAECGPLLARLDLPPTVMYADNDKWDTTAPVGSFPLGASPFGALDMAGNVAEWTQDWYQSYKGTPSHFQDGAHRAFRGSAWSDGDISTVRAAARHNANPKDRLADLGFRCASQP